MRYLGKNIILFPFFFWAWLEELAESVFFRLDFFYYFINLCCVLDYFVFFPQEWCSWKNIIFTCTLHIFCSNFVFYVIRSFYRIYIAESWVYRAVLQYIFSTFLLNKTLSLTTVVSDSIVTEYRVKNILEYTLSSKTSFLVSSL